MTGLYDRQWVERFYDEYGDKEWHRLVSDPMGEVKLYVHRHYLEKYVSQGDRVLEIGAGPGRFTQVLAEMGATVVIADVSNAQLELNRKYAAELGFDSAVKQRLQLDMCDMSVLDDAQFDAVVCYGGPLSYVFEQRYCGVGEVLRVLKPAGTALFSVMSLWGVIHEYLVGVLTLPPEINKAIVGSGDLCPENHPDASHHCHMFRTRELRDLLIGCGATVVAMSATNCLSAARGEALKEVRQDPVQWGQLLEMELEACREPGCLDMGTHTIAVIRKE